jgi:cytochrome c oxidase assembly protein subunit 11
MENTTKSKNNRTVALACVVFFVSMIGVAYASVPLYRLFCQMTGYGGTTRQVVTPANRVLEREITIRFDANVSGELPWKFEPKQREVTVKLGQTTQISYEAINLIKQATQGRATFNVVPELAGSYFNKLQCFCFNDTTLKAGEKIDMPVVFFIDPDMVNEPDLKNVKTITLSYTMFASKKNQPVAQLSDEKKMEAFQ